MTELSNIASKYLTDKGVTYLNSHKYTEIYDRYFNEFRKTNNKVFILEIGVQRGYDLLMINEYFKGNCEIYGLDIDLSNLEIELPDNIHVFEIDASNHENLAKLYESKLEYSLFNIPYFDIIIDDGSHKSNEIISSLLFFKDKLSDDGIYIIEDLHCDISSGALHYLVFYNKDVDDQIKLSYSLKSCNIYQSFKKTTYDFNRSICAILKFKN